MSLSRSGRRPTGPSVRVTGQPRSRSTPPSSPVEPCTRHGSPRVIATLDLVKRVYEHLGQYGHTITYPTGRARQVDDQSVARLPRQPSGEDRRGHLLPIDLPDCFSTARNLPIDHPGRHLGSEIQRGEPGSTGGDDQSVPGGDARAKGLLNGVTVGNDHGTIDRTAGGSEQLHQERS